MDSETRRKIEETVLDILRKTNLEESTEFNVRVTTSKQLGIDLSDLDQKHFVRSVIESFLLSGSDPESKEDRRRVICKLSERRNVVIDNVKAKAVVSIRELYEKDGKQHMKGINLLPEQWATFKKNIPAIEEAIKKMESKIRSEVNTKQTEDSKKIEDGKQTEDAKQAKDTKQTEDMYNLLNGVGPRELVTIETGRFDGKNYSFWAQQMERLLNQLKIVYVLFEPCPNSMLGPDASSEEIAHSKAAEQKWVNDDFLCHRTILNALSDDLFHLYSKKIMAAKDLWEDLKLMYLYEQFGTKRSLVKKYIEFEVLERKPIMEQVQELNDIANSIVASGMVVEEKFHVSVIISKLPPSWKDVSIKLMREEHLPFKRLMSRLKFEENSRIRENHGVPINRSGNLPGKSVPRMDCLRFEEESRTRENQGVPVNLAGNLPGKSVPRMDYLRFEEESRSWENQGVPVNLAGNLPGMDYLSFEEESRTRENQGVPVNLSGNLPGRSFPRMDFLRFEEESRTRENQGVPVNLVGNLPGKSGMDCLLFEEESCSQENQEIPVNLEGNLPGKSVPGMDCLRFEEESRIRENQGVPVNHAGNVRGKFIPRMRDTKPRSMQWNRREQETNGKVICQVCGKKGHFSQDCRYRSRRDDREANDKKEEGNGSMPTTMEVDMIERDG